MNAGCRHCCNALLPAQALQSFRAILQHGRPPGNETEGEGQGLAGNLQARLKQQPAQLWAMLRTCRLLALQLHLVIETGHTSSMAQGPVFLILAIPVVLVMLLYPVPQQVRAATAALLTCCPPPSRPPVLTHSLLHLPGSACQAPI